MSAMSASAEGVSQPRRRRQHEGIEVRHQRRCRSRDGNDCSCTPTYQAQVWSPLDRRPIRKTFATVAEAKAWRQESQVALRKGTLRAPSPTSLTEAAEQWLAAVEAGVIRTRSGDPYKPSAARAYRQALTHRVLPTLGNKRVTAISHLMLQDLADRLTSQGLSPSSVRNTILPLRAIYRRALNRGEVAINPPSNWFSQPYAAAANESPRPPRPPLSSTLSHLSSARSSRPPSTPDSASANSKHSTGATSTSTTTYQR
jgi:hypothetical protein